MSNFIPQRNGEGVWVCLKCGKRFATGGSNNNLFSKIFQQAILLHVMPKCPKCGSHFVREDNTMCW